MAEIFGHIDCPYCGYSRGMRIQRDKNGKPFGYCEANCNGQMRWGGNPVRERGFIAQFPGMASKMRGENAPVKPVTVTGAEPDKPAPQEAPKKRGFDLDF